MAERESTPPVPTYWDYLRLDRLLQLQGGLEGDEDQLLPDELHFIIVHQAYELWFKLILRSLRLARDRLDVQRVDEEVIPFTAHHIRRINAILRLGAEQFEVVETLIPQDFLAFRDKLIPASGFQSFQMRELEILLGLEESQRIHYGQINPLDHIAALDQDTPAGRLARQRVEKARSERTMLTVLHDWLYRTPIQGSSPDDPGDEEVVSAFLEEYLQRLGEAQREQGRRMHQVLPGSDPDYAQKRFASVHEAATALLQATEIPPAQRGRMRRIRAAALFIESYRTLPLLSWPRLLLDVVVQMEEQLIIWRHRHAQMVERLIGRRIGTGGSGGVDYLDRTTQYRIFRDLWAVRTVLLRDDQLPPLRDAAFYGFNAT